MDGEAMYPDARVLLVDDDPAIGLMLAELLASVGYRSITTLNHPSDFARVFVETAPDLVILDLNMPRISGFEILAWIRALEGNAFLPVLVLTGDVSAETRQRALSAGAKDFLTKPPDMTEALLRIHNLLETRFLHTRLTSQNAALEIAVQERTRELRDAVTDLARTNGDLRASHEETIRRLAQAAELRDGETAAHLQRIGAYAAHLASRAGLDETACEHILLAAPMHDIGKICVPDSVLMKRSAFDPTEYETMQTHAEMGFRILDGSDSPLLRTAATIAWTHHERWDGNGYPRGLRREQIPIEGRVVAVADAFDSMTNARRYRDALSKDDALDAIHSGAGTQFDPDLVSAFTSAMRVGMTIDLG